MWMYETPITCENLATTPCPLILVESNLRQPLDTSFLYGIAPLRGNGIILDLSQYCLHQTAPSSLIEDDITAQKQKGSQLDVYIKRPQSSLIEDDITAQKQKGSQLDVFLCSHPSATRDMQSSGQPMLSQSLPWKSPGIPRAVSVSRGDNTCRWLLMYSCDYPDSY